MRFVEFGRGFRIEQPPKQHGAVFDFPALLKRNAPQIRWRRPPSIVVRPASFIRAALAAVPSAHRGSDSPARHVIQCSLESLAACLRANFILL